MSPPGNRRFLERPRLHPASARTTILVNGKSTYSFAPKDNLTRGQLVAILYRAAGSPSVTGTTNPFNDVKTGDYYYNAVLWAYKNDVVNGTGAGKLAERQRHA